MLAYAAFYAQAYVIFNAAVFKAHGTHGAVFNAKAAFYAFFAVNLYFGGYSQFAADDEKQDNAGENVREGLIQAEGTGDLAGAPAQHHQLLAVSVQC